MAKRGKTVKKTVTITEISTKKTNKTPSKNPRATYNSDNSNDKTNKLLLENFIALQEALTSLGYETKELNKKVSSMLILFETAAKTFQEHPESRSLSSKIDELVEQNKIIAKSLLLMHKTTNEKLSEIPTKKEKNKGSKDFQPSITDEEPSEKNSEDVQVETDDSESNESNEDSDSSEEFKPEPLPEFNF